MAEERITGKFTDELRSRIERPATLNDVEGTQGKKKIIWVNNKPYVLKKINKVLEDFVKEISIE